MRAPGRQFLEGLLGEWGGGAGAVSSPRGALLLSARRVAHSVCGLD